jgi:hypothetical protein
LSCISNHIANTNDWKDINPNAAITIRCPYITSPEEKYSMKNLIVIGILIKKVRKDIKYNKKRG